jgi:hypothetical protein
VLGDAPHRKNPLPRKMRLFEEDAYSAAANGANVINDAIVSRDDIIPQQLSKI